MARASIALPGKREIHIASFAITKAGVTGVGEVVGTARSTMLAFLIHFIDHLDAHVRFRAAGNG
jgi:hypothetical protein